MCSHHTEMHTEILITEFVLYSDESVVQRQQKLAWSPSMAFFSSTVKEVYSFAGQDIVIEEGLDSYGGMIWPGVSDPSFPTICQQYRQQFV